VVFPKGEKGMNAFMLTEDDLKIIDSDVEREIMTQETRQISLPNERKVQEVLEGYQLYKSK
jgi:hypothetical protein